MTALQTLCDRAIWLNKGCIVNDGGADSVVANYLQDTAKVVLERIWNDSDTAPGNDQIRLHYLSITPLIQQRDELITVKTPIRFTAGFWNYLPGTILNFSVVVYNIEGVAIFNTVSCSQPFPEGLIWGSFDIPGDLLNDGTYTIRLLIVRDASRALLDLNNLLVFEVNDSERTGSWHGKWLGAIRPKFDWELRIDT
jgi:lipopolysaccharide transport system ATP-binding protein